MNQRAWQAWELYLKTDTCSDSMTLLEAIANDCYKVSTSTFMNYLIQKTIKSKQNSHATLLPTPQMHDFHVFISIVFENKVNGPIT